MHREQMECKMWLKIAMESNKTTAVQIGFEGCYEIL